jgi:sarcosine oxidase subunit beta
VKTDVLIVGGGLMGSCTALYLAMRGVNSIVLDKDHPGRHASGVNAGGLRKLNRNSAEIPLTLEASRIWATISELVDSDCDVKLSGQARVAENENDMELLEQRAVLVRDLGYEHEQIIGREKLYELVPALAPHCVGALWCEDDGFSRPYHATTAFRRKAEALGAVYYESTALNALEREGEEWLASTRLGEIRAPVVVNAAGAWGAKLAKVVGDSIPLKPGAPTLMVTERLPHFIDPVVGAASRKLSFKQMQNGTVIIGGAHMATLDMDREKTVIDYENMAESARTVTTLFPNMADARIVRFWAGIEGFTPDHIPVIGPAINAPGLYHAFGFSAHGYQLSPVVGRILSELILDGRSSLPIEPFRADRFGKNPG